MKSNCITNKSGSKWPLWKKLVLVGIFLIIVIPLSVGLGVGLTRGKNNDDNDDGDDDSNPDTPGTIPNNTALWQPEVGASWQIILLKPINDDVKNNIIPDVDIFDLDLYDNDASTFTALQKLGKKVICYFSAGSWEDWRDDEGDFDKADIGKELDGWPGEKWLNISSPNVRGIMKKRIEMASKKGCNAIDPDNVDGFVSSPRSLEELFLLSQVVLTILHSKTITVSSSHKTTLSALSSFLQKQQHLLTCQLDSRTPEVSFLMLYQTCISVLMSNVLSIPSATRLPRSLITANLYSTSNTLRVLVKTFLPRNQVRSAQLKARRTVAKISALSSRK